MRNSVADLLVGEQPRHASRCYLRVDFVYSKVQHREDQVKDSQSAQFTTARVAVVDLPINRLQVLREIKNGLGVYEGAYRIREQILIRTRASTSHLGPELIDETPREATIRHKRVP